MPSRHSSVSLDDEDDVIPRRHSSASFGDEDISTPRRHKSTQGKHGSASFDDEDMSIPRRQKNNSDKVQEEDDDIPMRHTSSFLELHDYYDDSVDDLMTLIELTNLRHLRKDKGPSSRHSTTDDISIDTSFRLDDNLLSASASCLAP